MRKLLSFAIILILSSTFIHAQYEVNSIPDEMLEDAHTILRKYNTTWEVKSQKEATKKVYKVVTILGNKGEDYARIGIAYNKFQKISDLKIRIYDKYGKELSKLKSKAFHDISLSSGFEIDDARAKYIDLSDLDYPFTYELSYTVKYNGILSIPTWQPQNGTSLSVEQAHLSILSNANFAFKFKEQNIKGDEQSVEEQVQRTWSVKSLKAIEEKPFMGNYRKELPTVKMAPLRFELDGYQGSMKTWNDFGIWYNKLLDDTEGLEPEMEKEILNLIQPQMSDEEKARIIYQYLQDNTRYVSIQLGIGGFRPFDAHDTHEKKYGDCKALSYYTYEMLKAVGIESNLALVQAGKNATEVDKDFPSNQFNHVIVCIPGIRDSVWLECTSQTNPFGYLGEFTSNRNVLLIKENGGELVRTPKYNREDNLTTTQSVVKINSDGSASGGFSQSFSGIEFTRSGFSYYNTKSNDNQEDWITDIIEIKDFDIETLEFNENEKGYMGGFETQFTSQKIGSTVGKRIFIKPILSNRIVAPKIDKEELRDSEYEVKYAYTNKASFIFEIPFTHSVEKGIKSYDLGTDYGTYKVKGEVDGNKLIITRSFQMNEGTYNAEQFLEFIDFLEQVQKADKQKITLVQDKQP